MEIFFSFSYKNVCILLFFIIYTLQHSYIIFLVDIRFAMNITQFFKRGCVHHIPGGCLYTHTCLYVCFYRGETAMCKISI